MLGMGCAGLFDEVAVAGCGLSGTVVWLWFGLDGVVLWEVYPDLEIYIYTHRLTYSHVQQALIVEGWRRTIRKCQYFQKAVIHEEMSECGSACRSTSKLYGSIPASLTRR